MSFLVWIIDEEWSDYKDEIEILQKELPNCELRFSTYEYEKDLTSFGRHADLIFAQIYAKIPASVIAQLEHCKGIAVYGGGYDRVDIKAARAKNIGVTNVRGYCLEDIADYVMAAIYRSNKQLDTYAEAIHQGKWGAQAVRQPIHRVASSTLFIAGCGTIGAGVAKKAKALGMQVVVYDPYVKADKITDLGARKVTLEEGFAAADFVSIHIKCDETTENLITKKYFDLMKPTAYLINTSRGKILNESDLIDAVCSKKIAGATLDVIVQEPPEGTENIFAQKNILITPHISYISAESYKELKRRTVENALKMLRGERPVDLVN